LANNYRATGEAFAMPVRIVSSGGGPGDALIRATKDSC
jgi:hypothetical protein